MGTKPHAVVVGLEELLPGHPRSGESVAQVVGDVVHVEGLVSSITEIRVNTVGSA